MSPGIRNLYYGRDGQPISREQGIELFEDPGSRRVARTMLDDGSDVSTVHLGLNHRFVGGGPPLIFETMVFGGPYSDYQWRYATEDDAKAGHERVVAALRAGREP